MNAAPSQTFPAAHYVIYGAEDYNTIWRLGEAQWKNDVETGEAMDAFVTTVSVYFYAYVLFDYQADYYYYLWTQGDFDAYYTFITYRSIAIGFFRGFFALYYSQLDWDTWLTGAFVDWDNWYSSDAIVPSFSAAPAFVDAQRQRLALGANHLELNKMHTEGYRRIRDALINVGVQELISNPPPLSVSISGPTVGRLSTMATIAPPDTSCGKILPIALRKGLSAIRTGYLSKRRRGRTPLARAVIT